jgi:hypothetical protein
LSAGLRPAALRAAVSIGADRPPRPL